MKTISIQAQPDRDDLFDETQIAKLVQEAGFKVEVKEGHDGEGRYINYYIETDDLAGVWLHIKNNLVSIKSVANSCIVICQGNHGWDDFLFLHHFDPETELDEM